MLLCLPPSLPTMIPIWNTEKEGFNLNLEVCSLEFGFADVAPYTEYKPQFWLMCAVYRFVCVIQNLMVFCPSGCAPSEWCLNSAWVWSAKRLSSCSHQLPAQPALTDSTPLLFAIFYSSYWPPHRSVLTARYSDWQAVSQVDLLEVQVDFLTYTHTITLIYALSCLMHLILFPRTTTFDCLFL